MTEARRSNWCSEEAQAMLFWPIVIFLIIRLRQYAAALLSERFFLKTCVGATLDGRFTLEPEQFRHAPMISLRRI